MLIGRELFLSAIDLNDGEEKIFEFMNAGSEVVRDYILSNLMLSNRTNQTSVYSPVKNVLLNRQILAFVSEGSRAGQMWHIFGVTYGECGF